MAHSENSLAHSNCFCVLARRVLARLLKGQALRTQHLPYLLEVQPACVERTRKVIKLFEMLSKCAIK